MADLTKATLTPPWRSTRQTNYYLHKRRVADLLQQIEKLKVLLVSADPEVVLRASQEIRDLHEAINNICKLSLETLPESIRARRRKRIPKAERKPKKVVEENIFRPQ